jgi:hypothetical protein
MIELLVEKLVEAEFRDQFRSGTRKELRHRYKRFFEKGIEIIDDILSSLDEHEGKHKKASSVYNTILGELRWMVAGAQIEQNANANTIDKHVEEIGRKVKEVAVLQKAARTTSARMSGIGNKFYRLRKHVPPWVIEDLEKYFTEKKGFLCKMRGSFGPKNRDFREVLVFLKKGLKSGRFD